MARFKVTYRVTASDAAEARQRAEGIALEQTVEIPRDIVPTGFIEDEILGLVESIDTEDGNHFNAVISYSPETAGPDLIQLLNVIFGNSSIQHGIRVVGFDPGTEIRNRYPGARFGVAGLRKLTGRKQGGLIAPVIKPMGSTSDELAEIAYRCALAGADLVKDDHGLANQSSAPFQSRVVKVAAAVARANSETGGNCLYFPNLAGAPHQIMEQAMFAKHAGAHGLLVMPGLFGFGSIFELANEPELGLPIMAHPSFLGSYVLSADTGFSHAVMFGVLQRLAGTDISVFPNLGGRFGFTREECISIAAACTDPDGIGIPMLPSPGGGMSPERAAEMQAMYGQDVVYLLGGSLLRYGDRIGEGIKLMRAQLD